MKNVVNEDLRALLKKDDGLRFRSISINENESMMFDRQSNFAFKMNKSGGYEVFTYEWVKVPSMEGEHLALRLRKYEN